MYLVYQEISDSVPTVTEITGSIEEIKDRFYDFITSRFAEGTIKPIYCGKYAEIYADDYVRICELVREADSCFSWVHLNQMEVL